MRSDKLTTEEKADQSSQTPKIGAEVDSEGGAYGRSPRAQSLMLAEIWPSARAGPGDPDWSHHEGEDRLPQIRTASLPQARRLNGAHGAQPKDALTCIDPKEGMSGSHQPLPICSFLNGHNSPARRAPASHRADEKSSQRANARRSGQWRTAGGPQPPSARASPRGPVDRVARG